MITSPSNFSQSCKVVYIHTTPELGVVHSGAQGYSGAY